MAISLLPKAYWRMEAVSGGEIEDAVGAHPLAVTGAGATSVPDGVAGQELDLASGGTFTISIADLLQADEERTLSMWFTAESPLPTISGAGPLLFSGPADFRLGFTPIDADTAYLVFTPSVVGGVNDVVTLAERHNVMVRMHLASGTTFDVEINIDGTGWRGLVSGTAGNSQAGTLRIGCPPNGFNPRFFGQIDEVAFWDSAIDDDVADEALALGMAGLSLLETPMSSISALALLRYGKHTSATQVESDSGVTYGFAEYEGDLAVHYRNRKLERNLRRGDGERYARVVGPRDTPTLGWNTLLRGLNDNSGGAVTTAKQTEIAPLLDVIMGADGAGGTGSVAAASGHSTTTLVVDDASAIPAGAAVLFESTTDGWIAREVVSKSSNTLTLDRAYTGDPVNDGVVYVACSWYPDNDAPNHVHLAADVEWLGVERTKMLGGMGSLVVDFPSNGGLATCAWSFDFSDDDPTAAASPSFVGPTVGNPIPCIDGTFWIGTDEKLLRDAKLSVTPTKAPKQHYGAANGAAGFIVTDLEVVLEGTLLMGAQALEATAATRALLQGASAQDIAFQLGRGPGASIYVRMPAADFDCDKGSVDGQDVLTFRAVGTRSPNQANVPGAARIHLF